MTNTNSIKTDTSIFCILQSCRRIVVKYKTTKLVWLFLTQEMGSSLWGTVNRMLMVEGGDVDLRLLSGHRVIVITGFGKGRFSLQENQHVFSYHGVSLLSGLLFPLPAAPPAVEVPQPEANQSLY